MKKKVSKTKNRYQQAYQKYLSELPDHKKEEIQNFHIEENNTRHHDDFAKKVIRLAESDQEISLTV